MKENYWSLWLLKKKPAKNKHFLQTYMGKMKTKKIVRKRFKITGTGKIMHRTQGMRHLKSKKSKARQRRQNMEKEVITPAFKWMIRENMVYNI